MFRLEVVNVTFVDHKQKILQRENEDVGESSDRQV
jgi:hypothetical protein